MTENSLQCEEPRVICGTRGVPGTVAPFRAWRGSRDLVAQSPKFHAPAVAPHFLQRCAQLQSQSLTHGREREQSRHLFSVCARRNFRKILWTRTKNRVP